MANASLGLAGETLELIREEPKLRFGCLELYVRLTDEEVDDQRDRLVVEEDVRQRVRVHWRSADASRESTSWRVSCAFSPWESQVAICETLGREAVDWLWDGLNALVLSLSLQAHRESALFAAEWPVAGRGGLFGFCVQELCRRVALERERFHLGLSIWRCRGESMAQDLLESSEEDTAQLRFEMAAFETPEEAMSLWEAVLRQDVGPTSAHLFVRVMLFDAQKQSMAALHFAQVVNMSVADPEIQADHKALQQLLSSTPSPTASCRLAEVLSPLIRGNCKSFLLCTVPERPGKGDEARKLLDLAEQASLITANCQRLQGKHCEDFHWAKMDDVLGRLRSSTESRCPVPISEPRSLEAAAEAARRSPADDAAGQSLGPSDSSVPCRLASGEQPTRPTPEVEGTGTYESPPRRLVEVSEPLVATPPPGTSRRRLGRPPTTPGFATRQASTPEEKEDEATCSQEYHELAAAVAALRAKNKAKAARRQRQLAEVRAEVETLSEGIQEVEDAAEAPILLQALRQELISLKDEVQVLRKANALLSGLHGEEKRRAAQRVAAKQLQQEATKLGSSRAMLEKGEKRAGLVQRCLEEVHARLDSAKIGKIQAENEINQLTPAFAELGRQLEMADTDRRWLQGELDKLRQASGGLRAEIVHLREVRNAVNAMPPEDSKESRMSLGRGGLERFATLQRRLATAAPQLMPLCTRARSSMEELLECCERLEERQKRLQQVAPLGHAPEVGDGISASKVSGVMEQRRKGSLPRSRSAETVGARSVAVVPSVPSRMPPRSPRSARQEQSVSGAAGSYEAAASPKRTSRGPGGRGGGLGTTSDLRGCCASCGARFTADAQFCQHCGSKRYPDPLPATRPSIRSTAGTLQDLGLDNEKARPEKVSTPRGGSFSVSLKTNTSGYSRPKLQPTPAWSR